MAVNAVQPAGAAAFSYANAERIGFGILMIAAPLLIVGAGLTHPPHGIESGTEYYAAAHDHSNRFYIAHTLFFLAGVLFVPATIGLARLLHPSRPKAAFWGGVLVLMGFMGYGAMDGMDYMTYVAGKPGTGLDPTTMQQYIDTAIDTIAIIAPTMLVFLLLPIGLGVLAVGFHRAGILPGWLAALMPIGMVGVAATLDYPVPLVISGLLLLVSYGIVGLRLLRAPDATISQPAPI
jgi:hypothetical protein